MSKLKSRKLWIAVIAGALVPLFKAFDVDLAPAEIAAVIGPALAYIIGQAKVDANNTTTGGK